MTTNCSTYPIGDCFSKPIFPCWLWNRTERQWEWCPRREGVALSCYSHWCDQPPPLPPPSREEEDILRLKERIAAFERAEVTTWAGWRSEANGLRNGIDNLRSLLGLSPCSHESRLQTLEIAIRDLVKERDEARDRLKRAGLSSPRTEIETKSIAPQQEKVHPWKPEEVPLGTWMRWKDTPEYRVSIASVDPRGITHNGRNFMRVDYLYVAEKMEYSTDGGKTWLPAGRVE